MKIVEQGSRDGIKTVRAQQEKTKVTIDVRLRRSVMPGRVQYRGQGPVRGGARVNGRSEDLQRIYKASGDD